MEKRISLADRKRTSELSDDTVVAEKHAEMLTIQEEEAIETQPPVAHHQERVRTLVTNLEASQQHFEDSGNLRRFARSPNAQHQYLIDEIKMAVSKYADELSAQSFSESRIYDICQAFADDVRIGLSRVGIHVGPLLVRKGR